MIVRRGTFADIPELLVLAKRAHALSSNAHIEFDEPGAKLLAANSMTTKGACFFVAVDEGGVLEGLLVGIEQEFGYLRACYAIDVVSFAESAAAARALVERFETWAFGERRVAQIMLGITFGGRHARAMGHIYSRSGFKSVGGVYTKNAPEPVRAEARATS
jgi:hypothetical protein